MCCPGMSSAEITCDLNRDVRPGNSANNECTNRVKRLLGELHLLSAADEASFESVLADLPAKTDSSFFSTLVSTYLDTNQCSPGTEDPELFALRLETRRLDHLISEREKFMTTTLASVLPSTSIASRQPSSRSPLPLDLLQLRESVALPPDRPPPASRPSLLAEIAQSAEIERLGEIDVELASASSNLHVPSSVPMSMVAIDKALSALTLLERPEILGTLMSDDYPSYARPCSAPDSVDEDSQEESVLVADVLESESDEEKPADVELPEEFFEELDNDVKQLHETLLRVGSGVAHMNSIDG